jgi:hypothetical protein
MMLLLSDLKGKSVFSSIGKASISARSAIVGPGWSPSTSATIPVFTQLSV